MKEFVIAIDDFFDVFAILNFLFAIWGIFRWAQLFALNHSKFRYLYILWMVVSFCFAVVYIGITFSIQPGYFANSGASIWMILLRPIIGLSLGASAVTAEIMKHQRLLSEKAQYLYVRNRHSKTNT